MERGRERPGARWPGGAASGAVSGGDQRQPARGVVSFDRSSGGEVGFAPDGAVCRGPGSAGARLRSGSGPGSRCASARSAPVGRVLVGALSVGSCGAGPVLGAAIACEPTRHAMAGHPENAGLLPSHRPRERLAASPALVRTQRVTRSAGVRSGPRQQHLVPLSGQAGGAQADVLLVSERALGEAVRRPF